MLILPVRLAYDRAMLTLYRRHSAVCPKQKDRYWKRCSCPMWVEGTINNQYIRRSLKTTSWIRASDTVSKLEETGDVKATEKVRVDQAVKVFLDDAVARELKASSIRKVRGFIEREFLPWLVSESYKYVPEIDLTALRRFRATWQNSARTKVLKQSKLSEFMRFCVQRGWAERNPVPDLGSIKVRQKPTDYFTPEQFQQLLDATSQYDPHRPQSPHGRRLKALLLLMRWSGLRIGDAVTLEKSRLQGDLLLLYMAKTGNPVFVPLPEFVVTELHSIPPVQKTHPDYFFWSGNGDRDHVAVIWQRAFRGLVKLAGITKRCHLHMLRDTFAVEMLLAGVPIERVSVLLGHSSIAMTEKHYAPFVKARQEQLIADVRAAWSAQSGMDTQKNALGDT
jgi:integrase/recombinase XerD